jgi:ribosomal-protein-serine acetyltransferase
MFDSRVDDRLVLRLPQEWFAQEIFDVVEANREHIARWLPWTDKTTEVAHTRAWIKTSLEQFARNDGFQACIVEDGQIVGGVGLHWIKWDQKRTEIGYWLAADACGRGIMTRCVRALCDQCFDTWHLNRVEIRAEPENERSWRVPERLGFVREGVLRQIAVMRDRPIDHVVYAMLRQDWRKASTGPA